MTYYVLKLVITTLLIVIISEVSRRSSFVGAVLASVPLVSVLAMIWLYLDTRDPARVIALSSSIFWLVLPSLALFIVLPILLARGVDFFLSMAVGIGVTVVCYGLMVAALGRLGIEL